MCRLRQRRRFPAKALPAPALTISLPTPAATTCIGGARRLELRRHANIGAVQLRLTTSASAARAQAAGVSATPAAATPASAAPAALTRASSTPRHRQHRVANMKTLTPTGTTPATPTPGIANAHWATSTRGFYHSTGNFSTGFANQGDIATGAFESPAGDMGGAAPFLARRPAGLFSADYRVHVPESPHRHHRVSRSASPSPASFTSSLRRHNAKGKSTSVSPSTSLALQRRKKGSPLLAGAISKCSPTPSPGRSAITVNI